MNLEKILSEVLNCMHEGDIDKAESLLSKILNQFPENPDALTQKGIILIHKKQFNKGITFIQSSLLIKPNQPEALLNLGMAFYQENKFDDAIKYFDDAIKIRPDYSEAFYTKALSYQNMNLIEEAINNFELAIKNNPNYIDPIINLGYLYYSMDKFELALNLFKKAEILSPNKKEYLYAIAKLHESLKHQEESIKYFSHLIMLYPDDSNSFNDRAVIYIAEKMFHEALQDLNVAIQLNPEDVDFLLNRSIVFRKLDLLLEAEADCKKALEFNNPEEECLIFNHMGLINAAMENFDIAFSFFDKSISLNSKYSDPAINKAKFCQYSKQFNLAKIAFQKLLDYPESHLASSNAGIFFLSQKEFLIGWDLYSSRMSIDQFKLELNFKNEISKVCSEWEGQLDCESLLIICEQGVGDQILHLSMLGELSKKIKKITVMLNFKLITLFERSFKGIHFISMKPNKFVMPTDICNFKYFIYSGDLGKFLRGSIESFRNQPSAYLKADLEKANQFRSKFKPTQLVCGLSWASQLNKGALYTEEVKSKSITLNDLLPLFNTATNLTYINLQYGDVKNEITYFKDSFGVEILDADNDNYNDLDGLASLIQSCDFVITTSNVTAHIAGALGKKTFVLVNPSMLWYWHDEDQSSWYPSVNIFQQKEYKNWSVAINSLVSRVSIYLKDFKHV